MPAQPDAVIKCLEQAALRNHWGMVSVIACTGIRFVAIGK